MAGDLGETGWDVVAQQHPPMVPRGAALDDDEAPHHVSWCGASSDARGPLGSAVGVAPVLRGTVRTVRLVMRGLRGGLRRLGGC